jgi:hypothetical protein
MEHLPHSSALVQVLDETIGPRLVTLRAADTGGQRSSANILVHRMYASRGYKTTAANDGADVKNLLTLVAIDGQETIGTLSLRFDAPGDGLLADDLFRLEIDTLRDQGRRVCEFTKLAMDHVVKSKRVLASLFHTAYLWAHGVMDHDDVVIEVNPRHVRFYRKALGFTVMGPERGCASGAAAPGPEACTAADRFACGKEPAGCRGSFAVSALLLGQGGGRHLEPAASAMVGAGGLEPVRMRTRTLR